VAAEAAEAEGVACEPSCCTIRPRRDRTRNGWLISVSGDREATLEWLPESPVPAELCKMGYALEEIGTGERFLHSHLIERFVRGADGELVLATKGWTRAIHCIGQWRCFAGRRKAHVGEARAYQIVRQAERLRGFKSAFGKFVAIPAFLNAEVAGSVPASEPVV
jgi:hypothetical protein